MNKLKNIISVIFVIIVIGLVCYKTVVGVLTRHLLKTDAQHTKAVIIDELNYMGNQPVKPDFSYSYQFIVNGEKYTGNAHDATLKVGDTVEIEYNKDHPSINKPLYPKE